jgi:hypothetical protein
MMSASPPFPQPAGKFLAAGLAFALGGYLWYYAFACIKKGVFAALGTVPSVTYRRQSPIYFWFCIALTVCAGAVPILLGVQALISAIS